MFDVAAVSSSGSVFSVALGWPSTQQAGRRLLPAPILRRFQLNLHGGRPSFNFMAALLVSLFPSGLFPGGEEDGRRWSLCIGGDQGLDCIAFRFSFSGFFVLIPRTGL
jgi:hypothetical protein